MEPLPRSPDKITAVVYTAYPWEHVLPVLRLVEPLRLANIGLIQGNDMEQVAPEKVSLADIVVIQRDFPRWETAYRAVIQLAHSEGKPLIYEIDDLLVELPEDHPDRPIYYYSRAVLPMLQAILEADAVTVSTQALREYLLPFNPNVFILPNYLADDLWLMQPPVHRRQTDDRPADAPVIIGYMGTTSHVADLEMIAEVLVKLLDQYSDRIVFQFWGIEPPAALRGRTSVQWVSLNILEYAQFARYFSQRQCDIFLAPLAENHFNQTKSSIKFLEYSSLGVPGVYSRITPYESIVRHNETGMLASSPAEWEHSLHQLIDDPALRRKIGSQAFEAVDEEWRLAGHALEWRKLYEQVARNEFTHDAAEYNRRMRFSGMLLQLQEWQADLEQHIVEDHQIIHDLRNQISEKELQIQQQASLIQELRTHLDEVYQSMAGKLARSMWGLHLRLAPPGSRREHLWNKLTHASEQVSQPQSPEDES